MEEKTFTRFEVGKLFPGPVPHREGAIMELWEIGLVVVIQFPGLRSDEVSAFHMRYYSLITELNGAVIYSRYMQSGTHSDLSDISQVFGVVDILVYGK